MTLKNISGKNNPRLLLVFCLLLCSLFSGAQKNHSLNENIKFVNFLHGNKEYSDALYVLNKERQSNVPFSEAQLDTLNYYLGWSYYNIKKLDSAVFYFSQVSDSSAFYGKSKFYEAFCITYSGNYHKADSVLAKFNPDSANEQVLKNFQQAGISLLKRDYKRFDTLSKKFTGEYFPIKTEETDFIKDREKLARAKKKSPLLAGTMSAILPGSGKLYAGYKGQAIAAFLQVASLGAVAGEAYARDGLKSPQFIIFGGLFSIFYVGNIWGSAASVRVKRQELNREVNNEVLFDLHIPLRRIYN